MDHQTKPLNERDGTTAIRVPFWKSPKPRNQHLNPRLYQIAGQSCYFTIRASSDLSPFARSDLADLANDSLLHARSQYGCEVDAYASCPITSISSSPPRMTAASSLVFVQRFKGRVSHDLRQTGWHGKVWQAGNYDHLVRKDEDMQSIVDYILYNRVRRGLCTDPEQYRWSGTF